MKCCVRAFRRTTESQFRLLQPERRLTLAAETVMDLSESAMAGGGTILAREEAIRPFNLAEGPLIRVRLFQLAEPQTQIAAGFDYFMVVTLAPHRSRCLVHRYSDP